MNIKNITFHAELDLHSDLRPAGGGRLGDARHGGRGQRSQNSATSLMTLPANFTRTSTRHSRIIGKTQTGDTVTVSQSHGGSSKQAESVVNGLEADVVTNEPGRRMIDLLHTSGRLLPANWATRLPHTSVPYRIDDCISSSVTAIQEHQQLG